MNEEIKQYIQSLNITRVSYNMAYPLYEGKKVNIYTGEIEDDDYSDLCFAKVEPNTSLTIFLGKKYGSAWLSTDGDSKEFVDTYFFDEAFNLLTTNNNSFTEFLSGKAGTFLGKKIGVPESCVYILQRSKGGYQKNIVITDLSSNIVSGQESVNMDYVWGQAVLNYDISSTLLKPYTLPLHIRKSHVDDKLSYIKTGNTIYPLKVLPNKKLKLKSDSKWSGIYSEYDENMELIRYEFPVCDNGYAYVTTTEQTRFIVYSYQNNTISPITLTIEYNGDIESPDETVRIMSSLNGYEIVDKKARLDIKNRSIVAENEEMLISLLECGGIIQLIRGKTYELSDTLIYNHDTTTIIGNGAILDFSSIAEESKPAIRVISKNSTDDNGFILGTLRKSAVNYIDGCYILGGNTTPNYEGGRNGIGILCEGNNETLQNSAFVSIQNCTIAGFKAGIVCRSQAWCVSVYDCNINVCDYGITVPYGHTNYGERISVINTTINTCTVAVSCGHIYGTIQCVNCSLGASFKIIYATEYGKIFVTNSHIESAKDKDYFFESTNHGFIMVTNSVFYCDGSQYGLSKVDGTSKIILKDNMKEHYSMPSNDTADGSVYIENWLNDFVS